MSSSVVKPAKFQLPTVHHYLALVLMIGSLVIASLITPTVKWFDYLGQPDFNKIIPSQFGDWADTGEAANAVIDPVRQGALNEIYTQIVSRVYLDSKSGRRIMLSLAYGDNQSYAKQLHRPESCYSSQGFQIADLRPDTITIKNKAIDVFRMTATTNERYEQVTYFVRVGDKIISGPANELNKMRLTLGLKGYIADGLLFRVSEIASNSKESGELQDKFVSELLLTLTKEQQKAVIGQPL